jgi:hypothetical protein
MCGRFTRTAASKETLADLFHLSDPPGLLPLFNIAPTQPVAAVRTNPESAKRELVELRWGLIPFWAEDPKIGYRMINARAETAATTTGTGDAIRQNAIYGNAAGGIGLFSANNDLLAPVRISAVWVNGTTTIAGTVAGLPGHGLIVEFFDNPIRTRQGESFLGSLTVWVGTGGHGNFAFQVSGGVNVGNFVTATATDAADNTSRFSKPVQVTGTDTAVRYLNGAPLLTGLTSTVPPAVRFADDPASTVALPLSQEVSTSPTVPSGATVSRLSITTAPHAADAVFAGWDTVADIAQQERGQALTATHKNPLSPNLENAQDPDLARLLEAWGKMEPKLKRLLLAALEPDRPGT